MLSTNSIQSRLYVSQDSTVRCCRCGMWHIALYGLLLSRMQLSVTYIAYTLHSCALTWSWWHTCHRVKWASQKGCVDTPSIHPLCYTFRVHGLNWCVHCASVWFHSVRANDQGSRSQYVMLAATAWRVARPMLYGQWLLQILTHQDYYYYYYYSTTTTTTITNTIVVFLKCYWL